MHHIAALVGSARSLREFRLLHATASRWGSYSFLVACAPEFAADLAVMEFVCPIVIVGAALVHRDGEDRNHHGDRCRNLLRSKLHISREAIRRFGYAFYMDVDCFVVSAFQGQLLDLLGDYEILASPHYMAKKALVECGAYNAGMFLTASERILEDWERQIARDPNGYGDQTAFNDVLSSSRVFDLPMAYNIGWWRYSAEAEPFSPVVFDNGQFLVGDQPVYNFHLRLSQPTDLSRLVSSFILTTDAHPEVRAAIESERHRQREEELRGESNASGVASIRSNDRRARYLRLL